VKVWTLETITVKPQPWNGGTAVQLPFPDRAGRDWKTVGIFDTGDVRAKGLSAFMEHRADKRMVVVLGPEPGDVDKVGAALGNCVVHTYDYPDPHRTAIVSGTGIRQAPMIRQLHCLSLPWAMVSREFYGKESSFCKVFVGGRGYDFDAACDKCPKLFERTLGQCVPCSLSCSADPHFGVDPLPMWQNPEPQRRWPVNMAALPMNTDGMPQDLFREAKHLVADITPFKVRTVHDLSTDEAACRLIVDARRRSAEIGALTRATDRQVCPGCLRNNGGYKEARKGRIHYVNKDKWCHKDGGSRCGGPYREEDFLHLIDGCEPWMAHVAVLGPHTVDARKAVAGWGKSRSEDQAVAGPRLDRWNTGMMRKGLDISDAEINDGITTGRTVAVTKRNSRRVEHGFVPYLWLCKRLNRKPVTSWDDEQVRNVPLYVRAACFLLSKGRGADMQVGGGWGGCRLPLERVHLAGTRLCLNYYNSRRMVIREIGKLEDCLGTFRQPGLAGWEDAVFSPLRRLENDRLKKYVLKDGLKLTSAAWAGMVRDNPDLLTGKLIPAEDVRIMMKVFKDKE
jgi:hypothetical protein